MTKIFPPYVHYRYSGPSSGNGLDICSRRGGETNLWYWEKGHNFWFYPFLHEASQIYFSSDFDGFVSKDEATFWLNSLYPTGIRHVDWNLFLISQMTVSSLPFPFLQFYTSFLFWMFILSPLRFTFSVIIVLTCNPRWSYPSKLS